jgi:hypothetical protein
MRCHTIYFSLQLLSGDGLLPVTLQCLRPPEIICDFVFQLRLRHHRIERWLGLWILLRPDSVTPINFFNRSLIGHALGECQSGSCRMGNDRLRCGLEQG